MEFMPNENLRPHYQTATILRPYHKASLVVLTIGDFGTGSLRPDLHLLTSMDIRFTRTHTFWLSSILVQYLAS